MRSDVKNVGLMLIGIAIQIILPNQAYIGWMLFYLGLILLLASHRTEIYDLIDGGETIGLGRITPDPQRATFGLRAKNLEINGFYLEWHATASVEISNGPKNLYIRSAELRIADGSSDMGTKLAESSVYMRMLSKLQIPPDVVHEKTYSFRLPASVAVDSVKNKPAQLIIVDQYDYIHKTDVPWADG